MNKKSLKSNLIYAMIAQFIAVILSIAMYLLVPKILSQSNYSYWQLFIFYTNYSGFFHLGLVDGFYLRYGGKEYSELNKSLFGSQLKLMILFHIVVAIIFEGIVFNYLADINRAIVISAAIIYIVLYCAENYLGFLFQAVNRTKFSSISTILDKLLILIFVTVFLFFKVNRLEYYLILYIFSKFVALAFLIYKAWDIIKSPVISYKIVLKEVKQNIIVGIKIMFAGIAGSLIIGNGRIIIDMAWGIEAFGKISFSIVLTNFLLLFMRQVSMVLFPALRQSSDQQIKQIYTIIGTFLKLYLPLVFFTYAPIKYLLSLWLPQYSESLSFLALLLPICVFDGKINMLCNTYFKVLRKENALFTINVITMLLSLLFSLMGAYLFKNFVIIIVFLVLAIIFRSVVSEIYLGKLMNATGMKEIISEVMLAFVFMLSAWFLDTFYAYILLSMAYVIFLIISKKDVKFVINLLRQRMQCK